MGKMQNALRNFIVHGLSVIAVILLIAGTGLILTAYIGLSGSMAAGIFTLVFAVCIAILSLAASNYFNFVMSRQLGKGSEIANEISQGRLPRDFGDGDLLTSLRKVKNYVEEKSTIADKLAAGELAMDVHLHSDSDVLGKSFQAMIARLRAYVPAKEDHEQRRDSLNRLFGDVSEAASGNLTVLADVSNETTGAVAEAFNSMTKNLRKMIKEINGVAERVGDSAGSIGEASEQLARGGEAQASQISRTTSAVSTLAREIQEVSANAAHSARLASESLDTARKGTLSARDNINAVNLIRNHVQDTAKRIKKLGERSQEISQIVKLIDDLSDRTSLLALNASLRASSASDSNSGLSIMTEEVERLAERSTRLTQQISALAQTLLVETKEAVASMEETIHEVVVGSTLASKTGRFLLETEDAASKLNELLQSIAESAKYQAKSSVDVHNALLSLSKVNEVVQMGSNRSADSAKTLMQLSTELQRSVSPFKLAEDLNLNRLSASETNSFVN